MVAVELHFNTGKSNIYLKTLAESQLFGTAYNINIDKKA